MNLEIHPTMGHQSMLETGRELQKKAMALKGLAIKGHMFNPNDKEQIEKIDNSIKVLSAWIEGQGKEYTQSVSRPIQQVLLALNKLNSELKSIDPKLIEQEIIVDINAGKKDLSNLPISSPITVATVFEWLEAHPKQITSADFSQFKGQLTDKHIKRLVTYCPELETLNIEGNGAEGITGKGIQSLANNLTKLQTLHLPNNPIGDGIITLAASNCPIVDLNLSGCQLTSDGVEALAGSNLPIKALDLSENKNINEGIKAFKHSELPLETLNLTNCGINAEGVKALANSNLPLTGTLTVAGNLIGDEGFIALAVSNKFRLTIEHKDSGFTPKGGEYLKRTNLNVKNLKTDLDGSKFKKLQIQTAADRENYQKMIENVRENIVRIHPEMKMLDNTGDGNCLYNSVSTSNWILANKPDEIKFIANFAADKKEGDWRSIKETAIKGMQSLLEVKTEILNKERKTLEQNDIARAPNDKLLPKREKVLTNLANEIHRHMKEKEWGEDAQIHGIVQVDGRPILIIRRDELALDPETIARGGLVAQIFTKEGGEDPTPENLRVLVNIEGLHYNAVSSTPEAREWMLEQYANTVLGQDAKLPITSVSL